MIPFILRKATPSASVKGTIVWSSDYIVVLAAERDDRFLCAHVQRGAERSMPTWWTGEELTVEGWVYFGLATLHTEAAR